MVKIIKLKNRVICAINNDDLRYLDARQEIEQISQKKNLRVVDMPTAIHLMTNYPEIREVIEPFSLNTLTSECYGKRKENNVYEVWHGVGSLTTQEGLNKLLVSLRPSTLEDQINKLLDKPMKKCGLMEIDRKEWNDVGNKTYLGQDIVRVHLNNLRKGDVPEIGTPYIIFVNLDKNKYNIKKKGDLTYDDFMTDDSILMITGSSENRKSLGEMLFGKDKNKSRGMDYIYNNNRIDRVIIDKKAKGSLISLQGMNRGFNGEIDEDYSGRFLAISKKFFDKNTESKFYITSLELIAKKIINHL